MRPSQRRMGHQFHDIWWLWSFVYGLNSVLKQTMTIKTRALDVPGVTHNGGDAQCANSMYRIFLHDVSPPSLHWLVVDYSQLQVEQRIHPNLNQFHLRLNLDGPKVRMKLWSSLAVIPPLVILGHWRLRKMLSWRWMEIFIGKLE